MKKIKILKIISLLFIFAVIFIIIFITGYLCGSVNSYKKCLIEYDYGCDGSYLDHGMYFPYFCSHFISHVTREPHPKPGSDFYTEDKLGIFDFRLCENGELGISFKNDARNETVIPADRFNATLRVVNNKRADIECSRLNSDIIFKPGEHKSITLSCGKPEEGYICGSRYFVSIRILFNESSYAEHGNIWGSVER